MCTSWPFGHAVRYAGAKHNNTGWRVMKKFLVIVCSLALALGVVSCAGKGKAPIGKGKAPVVTKG